MWGALALVAKINSSEVCSNSLHDFISQIQVRLWVEFYSDLFRNEHFSNLFHRTNSIENLAKNLLFFIFNPVLHSENDCSTDLLFRTSIMASCTLKSDWTQRQVESKLLITDKNSVNFVFLLDSVACHSAFSFRTQHFVQRVEIWKNRRNFQPFFNVFKHERKIGVQFSFFCTRCCLQSFWREISRESLFKFLPK